ncbi:hypothetical protein RB601_000574 [Gaeumannomyces tritici]
MVSADRQTIIETNKSLRIIKNELESLYEKGVIDDQAYDGINSLLPAEASLAGARAAAAPSSSSSSTPAPAARAPPPAAPTPDISNLSIRDNNAQAPPPPYGNPSPSAAAAAPPPPPPSGKPVLSHARALYRYAGADAHDCAFERDDRIAVHEYMNADWWMGRNLRTGREGIFPRNYVEPEAAPVPAPVASPQQGYPVNEKAVGGGYYGGGGGAPPPQQQQQPYGQPAYGYQQQQNPYNAPAPPMAVANPPPAQQQEAQPQKESFAKKAGSKLGNAALFGAGATLGGNIVNSIF